MKKKSLRRIKFSKTLNYEGIIFFVISIKIKVFFSRKKKIKIFLNTPILLAWNFFTFNKHSDKGLSQQFPYWTGFLYLHVNCHRFTLKLWIPVVAFTVFVFSLLLIAHYTVISALFMGVSLPCCYRSRWVCSRSMSCSVTVDRTVPTTSALSFGPVPLSPRRNAVVVVSTIKWFN